MGVFTQLLVRKYLTTRIIPLIAVGAVALCVALVVIVVSVMTGFLDTLRNSGRTLMGDVIVSYPVQGIAGYQDLMARLRELPEVKAVTPLIETHGLARMPYPAGPRKEVGTVQVWGIDPESFTQVSDLGRVLYWKPPADRAARAEMAEDDPRLRLPEGMLEQGLRMRTADGRPAMLTGMHVSILNKRQPDGSYRRTNADWWLPEHDITLTLVPVSDRGTLSQNSRVFPVANEVMTGVFQIDRNRIYIPIDQAQQMLRLDEAPIVDTSAEPNEDGSLPILGTSPARATQVMVRGVADVPLETLREAVWQAYVAFYKDKASDPSVLVKPPEPFSSIVQTWEDRLSDVVGPVEKERQMMRILFSITYLVCAGLILAIFWSIVNEKTRDIGILRAVGASRVGVLWIFLKYGLAVGVMGSSLGVLVGWVVVRRINAIHEALGHAAPGWTWKLTYALAALALVCALRAMWKARALPSLLWLVTALALASAGYGLMSHQGFLMWDPAVYYFTRIPSQVDWPNAIGTAIGAIVFSVLGAAVPAARAADIDPVRALRYE